MQHKFDECLKIGGDLDESMRQYLGDVYQIDKLNVGRVSETSLTNWGSETTPSWSSPATTDRHRWFSERKVTAKFSNNMLGYAGQFRGGKHDQYEGGTRVPFIIRWPDKVEAGRVDTQNVCSFIDWLPTLCAIAGVDELPQSIDGEDISDILCGSHRERLKALFWKTSATGSTPAMRDGKWKLHLPRKQRGEPELYDLSIDPSESNNVAAQNPDVVKALSRKVKAWVATLPREYSKTKSGGR